MALQKVKDSMRTTVALDATKLAGAVPTGSLGNAVAADNSITLEKMAPGTDGQVITYSAAGDPVAIGPGTAGQVLTSAGANLPQTFADAGGGAWAVKSSGTFSSVSSLDITGLTKTTQIFLSNVDFSADTYFRARVSTDNGSTFEATNYQVTTINRHSSLSSAKSSVSQTNIYVPHDFTAGGDTNEHTSGIWTIHNPADTTSYQHVQYEVGLEDTAGTGMSWASGRAQWRGTTAVNAFQFYPDSGTMTGSYVCIELN